MESPFILFYLMEITNLIDQSVIAFDLIFDTLKKMKSEISGARKPRDPNAFYRSQKIAWMYVMTFLALSANVSKLLFPAPRKDHKSTINRGKTLRKLLDVNDDSLLENRDLRDHFEHFDERLDIYFQSTRKHTYIDMNIGDLSEFKGLDRKEVLRHLDDKNQVVIFLGEEYDIKALKQELISINDRVLRKINPHFLDHPTL